MINIITDHILSFEDPLIINAVLELLTLFTREKETAILLFKNKAILSYIFNKLKSDKRDTLRLSALALSRLAARLDENNSDLMIENLRDFRYFDLVVANINKN